MAQPHFALTPCHKPFTQRQTQLPAAITEPTPTRVRAWLPLGYGRFVRADDIVAVLPIKEGRRPGRRTHVHVPGLTVPIVASRSETRSSRT